MQFNTDNYATESIAAGAAIGAVGVALLSAIGSIMQAERAMEALEQRMAEWDNPGLKFQPIRREFILAQLEKIEAYLFTQLPSEIETLRKINIDLNRIAAEPYSVFLALKSRILIAGEGLHDDARGEEFAQLIDQPLPPAEAFDPAKSPLHAEFTGLELMKKQHLGQFPLY